MIRRHITFHCSLVLIVAACLQACASPQPDPDVQTLATAGSAYFHSDFSVFMVPSSGTVADETFISASKLEPSEMSKQLSQLFATSETQEVKIVVGGPNSTKTTAVVVGAATLLEGKSFEHLSVLFVGEASDARLVREAIEGIGGTFRISSY